MATDRGIVDFVLEQAAGAGAVTARRMFGEYGLWLDGRMVALICDGRLFVRDLPTLRALAAGTATDAPYPGARPHLVIEAELDDPPALAALLRAAWKIANPPKPGKGRKRPASGAPPAGSPPAGPSHTG